MKKSSLIDESLEVSFYAIELYKALVYKNEYVLSKQFLRSATSIGANIREAKYAESKKDFIHKFTIALKECNETLYWLQLIKYSEEEHISEIENLIQRCNSILRMLSASIQTTKRNLSKSDFN